MPGLSREIEFLRVCIIVADAPQERSTLGSVAVVADVQAVAEPVLVADDFTGCSWTDLPNFPGVGVQTPANARPGLSGGCWQIH